MALGELEAKILGVVREKGKATARDVLRVLYLDKDIAYSTVSTTLMRLHKKGLLEREAVPARGKIVYVYGFLKATSHRAYVGKLVDRLVHAFGSDVVSAAVEDAGIEEE